MAALSRVDVMRTGRAVKAVIATGGDNAVGEWPEWEMMFLPNGL